MEKIFYAENSRFPSSTAAVRHILDEYFRLPQASVHKTETGKPYLQNTDNGLFFSLSHTKTHTFIAFCEENVGIDAERLDRECNYPPLLKKFSVEERREIHSREEFLQRWTVKESAVKWLGGTLARDLQKIAYAQNRLTYGDLDIPVFITMKRLEEHLITICSEKDFSNAELILL